MSSRRMKKTILYSAMLAYNAVYAEPAYKVPAVPLVWADVNERLQRVEQGLDERSANKREAGAQRSGQQAQPRTAVLDSAATAAAEGRVSADQAAAANSAFIPPAVPLVMVDAHERLKDHSEKDRLALERQRELPRFEQRAERAREAQTLKQAKKSVRESKPLHVAVPGRKGSTSLPRTRSGVPIFDFFTSKETGKGKQKKSVKIPVSEIPVVDVGREDQISARVFRLEDGAMTKPAYEQAKRLPSRETFAESGVRTLTQTKSLPIVSVVAVDKKHGALIKAVTLKQVQDVAYQVGNEKPVSLLSVNPFSSEQEMLLTALLLYKDGANCEAVIGMFDKLKSSTMLGVKEESTYHLGICAGKLGLLSEQYDHLLKLIKAEDPNYAAQAISSLLSEVPYDQEVDLAVTLHALKNRKLIDSKQANVAAYHTAKGLFRKGHYAEAERYARQVAGDSSVYHKAQYILSISQVMRGAVAEAIRTQESLLSRLSQPQMGGPKQELSEVKTLVAVNLARTYFEKGQYEKALEYFRQVSPDHPLRLQTLVELGWSQLNAADFSGAVGNMHSIHIPRYSLVYQPESHVVRTIGYLKMCQYGDAYKSLRMLEHRYDPWHKKMVEFRAKAKGGLAYYDALRHYLSQGHADAEVDGLPASVIREMARQKKFLNLQSAINGKVAERDQGLAKVEGQIQRKIELTKRTEGQARASMAQLQSQLSGRNGKHPKLAVVNRSELERELRHYQNVSLQQRYLRRVLTESLAQFKSYKGQVAKRIAKDVNTIKAQANAELSSTMKEMVANLGRILENNELLKYEVYAGAGENIRYRVAGGEGQALRIPASIQNIEKNMNWNFEGEVWADEIGHFRSNLKNLCGQTNTADGR